jgi:hypothetical protein
MGRSPIFEPISNKDKMAIGFLFRHGARVEIANNSSNIARSYALQIMPEMWGTFMKASKR